MSLVVHDTGLYMNALPAVYYGTIQEGAKKNNRIILRANVNIPKNPFKIDFLGNVLFFNKQAMAKYRFEDNA